MSWLGWTILLLVFATAIVGGLWGYRAYTTGDTSFNFAWLFPPRPEPRLGIIEQVSVDSQRKLVLIRRDDVEHLIMTGGPLDVVIETRIAIPRQDAAEVDHQERQEPAPPVFARKPRGFGQAANE